MDSFEQLVASLLEHDGHWVRASYKVELIAADKAAISRPSAPRWEIDLVAYKGATNEILIVECKSFLNSRGVTMAAFESADDVNASRYKLFNDVRLLRVVRHRLVAQLTDAGACRPRPRVRLCLVVGRIASETDRARLCAHFRRKGWTLWDETWIAERLRRLADGGYQDDVASVVAKLLRSAEKKGTGDHGA